MASKILISAVLAVGTSLSAMSWFGSNDAEETHAKVSTPEYAQRVADAPKTAMELKDDLQQRFNSLASAGQISDTKQHLYSAYRKSLNLAIQDLSNNSTAILQQINDSGCAHMQIAKSRYGTEATEETRTFNSRYEKAGYHIANNPVAVAFGDKLGNSYTATVKSTLTLNQSTKVLSESVAYNLSRMKSALTTEQTPEAILDKLEQTENAIDSFTKDGAETETIAKDSYCAYNQRAGF